VPSVCYLSKLLIPDILRRELRSQKEAIEETLGSSQQSVLRFFLSPYSHDEIVCHNPGEHNNLIDSEAIHGMANH